MQKKVTITIDDDLNTRWGKVSKKIRLSKSGMVQDFLSEVIPLLEKDEPRDVMAHALKHLGEGIGDMSKIFEKDRIDDK